MAIAGAILISSLTKKDFLAGRWDVLPYVILLFLIGSIISSAPEIGYLLDLSEWTNEINRWWALPLIVFGAIMLIRPAKKGFRRLLSISIISPLLIIVLFGMLKPVMSKGYDLRKISMYLGKMQRQGYVIANYGKYHGQFHFLGKLKQPIIETGDGSINEWLIRNPKAKVISVQNKIGTQIPKPDFIQKYRGKYILVWDRSLLMIHPNLAKRK
jgi:hypothetical protein